MELNPNTLNELHLYLQASLVDMAAENKVSVSLNINYAFARVGTEFSSYVFLGWKKAKAAI